MLVSDKPESESQICTNGATLVLKAIYKAESVLSACRPVVKIKLIQSFIPQFFLNRVLFHYVAQAGLELKMLLPQAPG
jgi:hypothetical protein